jgi:hypothetical protein
MTERREVRVGDEHYVLRPFRGLKAVLVLERVTKLLEVLPEIQAEARTEFRRQRDENVIEIDRAVFEFRYPEDAKAISETAWQEAGQKIRLPDDMPFDTAAVVMAVLPKVLKFARTDVMEVLSLVVLKDKDLQDADQDGTIEELISEQAKKLLYDGTLEELADLAVAAFAQIQELSTGKVRELLEQATSLLTPDLDDDPLPIEEDQETMSREDSNETSSISSPESTDGPESRLSGSDSMTSSPSPAG